MTQPCSGILTSLSQPARNPTTEFFKGIMRDSGVKLMTNDDPNTLTQEQALVVRDIDKLLESDPEDNIDNFLRGFRVLVKKEKYLRKALLPSAFKQQRYSPENEVEMQQDSLFRIFLKVNRLQKEIIDILLDELTSTIADDGPDAARLRLLLTQLRYLPHIKDPQSLTTKLLDVMDIASFPSQLEILESIPEILPDSEYYYTATELMKMLDKSDDLAGAVIDCLNALGLNTEIRAQVQDHILSKMLTGSSTQNFPVFLDFLMSDWTSRSSSGTLVKIRNALNAILGSEKTDKEKESSKIVIFNRLQKSAVSKAVSESWLSLISNIKVHTDHKHIDLIILFMLHSSTKLKKRTIETTFRKHVKEGLFRCLLLEQVFEKYFPQQLLCDYFTSVVEVGSSLLRGSYQPVIIDFASTLFKLLFTHEYTERVFRQEILENMMLLVGSSDQKNVTATLNLLTDLLEDIAKCPNHAIILMRLLEKLDAFELNDVRLVFEILCRLTCYDESLGLKEELHMVVRKYLSSSKRSLRVRGIISAVVMAKHIATSLEDQSDLSLSEDTILSVDQLNGAAKEAAALLELTNTSASISPELIGLYYDQLGSMLVKSDNLDRNFLTWLYELITNEFQHIYVADNVSDDINDLEFSKQFNINTFQEVDNGLGVNIAKLALKPDKNLILVLAPHFRLLRILHFRHHNGDLSSIDALLGCGVVLPKFEQRDSLGIEQLKQMADCIFFAINWFRETVSGFVVLSDARLRSKVVQRIDHLHELKQVLTECLESVPSHKLPQSYFSSSQSANNSRSPIKETVRVGKAPRKKIKTREFVEDTTVAPSTSKPVPKTKEESSFTFREIDTDLVRLLKYPLKYVEVSSSNQITLNLNQFNFILIDYVAKLSKLTKKRDLGLSHLSIVVPSELMSDCHKVLLNLKGHFEVIIQRMDKIEECEEDEAAQLKLGFGLVLECLSLIFSWSGFQHSKRLDMLREILKAFRSDESSIPLNSVHHLTEELVNRLAEHTEYCSSLKQAVDLINTTEALHAASPNHSTRSKIAKTAGKLLNQKWKTQTSANIDVLIRSYLSGASIKAICGMVGTLQDEAPNLTNKTDSLEMLRSVTKSNFYIFYRNLWTTLLERVKTDVQSLTNAQHLTLWRTTTLTMQGLMTVAQAQESRNNLACFLKNSIAILKIFLSHGMPILEIELKSEPDRVVEILKTIQANTRFLHRLCCHSKLTKDASLMNYVPQFRLTLETLLLRVKAALVANGCSDAFWMGNLKNKGFQGELILSQRSEASRRDEEEEEDEEMPSDDNFDDEDEHNSDSEVF